MVTAGKGGEGWRGAGAAGARMAGAARLAMACWLRRAWAGACGLVGQWLREGLDAAAKLAAIAEGACGGGLGG